MRRRLAQPGRPAAEQAEAFIALLRKFAATAYGERHGLTSRMTYAPFREAAPLQTYAQVEPEIRRMQHGEGDVLWPGQCTFYAVTAGTTGLPKSLPMTEDMLTHFNTAARDALLYYTARIGHTRVFQGRHLLVGGSTTLLQLDESEPFVAYAGELSALATLNMPVSVEQHLYEPGAAIAQITEWTERLPAIVQRTLGADISLVAGFAPGLIELAGALLRAANNGTIKPDHLQDVWPKLECLVHGGMPIGPFQSELRAAFGPGVNFHEVYVATEAFIAAQDGNAGEGLRLMTGTGVFFEFLPLKDYDPARLASLSAKTLRVHEVRAGENYLIVLTTPAGLCRHVSGDIVRFLSVDPPRLVYVGRTEHQLSAFGEQVTEKEVTDALTSVCQRHGWTIINFHVAPHSRPSLTGRQHARHEWWVELRAGTVQTPIGVVLARELDAELARVNAVYAAKRTAGALDEPVVRLVIPGVFEHWLRFHRKWGGQGRISHARGDRSIADALSQIAPFTDA